MKHTRYCAICNKQVEFEVADPEDEEKWYSQRHLLVTKATAQIATTVYPIHIKSDKGRIDISGRGEVIVYGNGTIGVGDDAVVECDGCFDVTATGYARVKTLARCRVLAHQNAYVELGGTSIAIVSGDATAITRSPLSVIVATSPSAKASGNVVKGYSLPAQDYLARCGVKVNPDGTVILYKSVREDFTSFYNRDLKYELGKEVVAPDWINAPFECGFGLHFSPTPWQARTSNDAGVYLACRVKVEDIAPLPDEVGCADKIRARACVPLYRVDVDGNKI